MRGLAGLVGVVLVMSTSPAAQSPVPADTGIPHLIEQLEQALMTGAAVEPLVDPEAPEDQIRAFRERWFATGITRATARERDRQDLRDGGHRLVVEILLEQGAMARLATWEMDVRPSPFEWRIIGLRTLSVVEGLHRLALDRSRGLVAENLVVRAEDLELRLPKGSVFIAETSAGNVTLAVLVGRGEMVFHPAPATERGQIRLLTGDERLVAGFDMALVRLHPVEFQAAFGEALRSTPPDAGALRRAQAFFSEQVARSFSVDLADLSRETWSLIPAPGDFLAEVRTRRWGQLTYAKSRHEAEDISVFDRARRRNLSVYTSRARLAARGPFYNEDDGADYDILDYDVDVTFQPERLWFDGRTRLKLRVRTVLASLTLRLNEAFAVRSVTSDLFGRLLHLRVRGHNSVIVSLPATLTPGQDLAVTVAYSGRLEAQPVDRENLTVAPVQQFEDRVTLEPEPNFLYSNRSYWYAQSSVSDYATATIRLTVPETYRAVCSGEAAEGSPVALGPTATAGPRRLHLFAAVRPLRYLGCVVSRFGALEPRAAMPGDGTGAPAGPQLAVQSTPRQRARARELVDRAADIAAFYTSLVGESPYPKLTLAVVESYVPGGHSPAYFAALNQPLPTSPFVWRNDPSAFDGYPDFFVAHEVAHQWWGQAVGWSNYHEQWLSEGLSQYFAALYAERQRGPETFGAIVRQMSRWAMRESAQGPIYLGYRLGQFKGEGVVFRALVYNKAAAVLHMLRRLAGDETFFKVLARFYRENRFRKTHTDALRRAVELETGEPYGRFFERWIYGSALPSARASWSLDGDTIVVRVTQHGDVFDFPLTVTLRYPDGRLVDHVVSVRDESVEARLPTVGRVESVIFNRDSAALVRID